MDIVLFQNTKVAAFLIYQMLETVVLGTRVRPLNESQSLPFKAAYECQWIDVFQTKTIFLIYLDVAWQNKETFLSLQMP